MRIIRWSSKLATGNPQADQVLRELVDTLNGVAREAQSVEHCQDLTELYGRMRQAVEEVRAAHGDDTAERLTQALRRVVHDSLEQGLPLPAKGGPACTDCGMCDLLQQRLTAWLEATSPNESERPVD